MLKFKNFKKSSLPNGMRYLENSNDFPFHSRLTSFQHTSTWTLTEKKVKFVFLEISTIHHNANATENETKFWKFKKLYLKNYRRYTKSLNAFTLWIVPSLFTCKFGDRKCVIIGDTITRKRVWALISPSIIPPFTKFELQDT